MAKTEEHILQLRAKLTANPCSREQQFCRHAHITVVEERRLLCCTDCGLWIEPLTYLMGWANKDWAAEQIANHWDEEARRLCNEVQELKRVRRNLKAQIRRLKQQAEGISGRPDKR